MDLLDGSEKAQTNAESGDFRNKAAAFGFRPQARAGGYTQLEFIRMRRAIGAGDFL